MPCPLPQAREVMKGKPKSVYPISEPPTLKKSLLADGITRARCTRVPSLIQSCDEVANLRISAFIRVQKHAEILG